MKKTYLKPQVQAVAIHSGSALLTFSDPHSPYVLEGSNVFSSQSLEGAGLEAD